MVSKWWNLQIVFLVILVCITAYLVITDTSTKQAPVHTKFKPHREKKKRKCNKQNEQRCRNIIEQIFKKPFPQVRPSWLRNPKTHKRLEIDMFNPSIHTPIGKGLGIEYDGVQHSQYTPFYHTKGPHQFVEQCERDANKDRICKEKGILLIRIPSYVAQEKLEEFIRDKLKQHSVEH